MSTTTARSGRRALAGRCRLILPFWACSFGLLALGCGSFNPAFLSLIDTSGTGEFGSLDNAPGHVVITLINNAEVDERLLAYLESSDGGNLVLTDAEKRSLRPRMRMRVRITFTDGTSQTVEFIDGSQRLVDQSFDTQSLPDLNQNDLNNVVVVCDVASVQLEPGSAIDVFVPVEITGYDMVEVTGASGNVVGVTYEPRERTAPQFRTLRVDEVDADGNVTVRRNIDARDVLSPTLNPQCGSVIAIVVDGVLSVPFLATVSDAPSYDRADLATIAGIGGRFEFRVSVQ